MTVDLHDIVKGIVDYFKVDVEKKEQINSKRVCQLEFLF